MVKFFSLCILLFSLSSAQDAVDEKIQSFLDERTYTQNIDFINVIFDPKSDFYKNDRVDSVKVVQTLKENGLLALFFRKPKELTLNFKTSGSPLFFVKLMGDTLRNMGYYRYVTIASNLDASEFTWNINLTSEYATDPLILEKELNKNGCRIIDISRESQTEWTYVVDMSQGFLNIDALKAHKKIKLKRSLYAYWLNISKVDALVIRSSKRNRWYPHIAYYDSSLHLLKVLKEDESMRRLRVNIPQNTKYMKISDVYTLKNVRDGLQIEAISGN